MTRETRRFGGSLLLAGAAGVVFFILTDPRFAAGAKPAADYVDAVIRAGPGTYIGVAGSILTACIGLWLMLRPVS